jgi:hypothetical protein
LRGRDIARISIPADYCAGFYTNLLNAAPKTSVRGRTAQELNDMKLVSYQYSDNQVHLGAVSDDRVINLNQASGGAVPDDMLRFLQLGSGAMQTARDAVAQAEGELRLDEVKLLSPVPNPSKVVAIGLNYMDHICEANLGMPELATMFCKYPSSVIGSGEDIRWSTSLTEQVDYEAELAVVIGKTARNVDAEVAYDYVAGYMNCNGHLLPAGPLPRHARRNPGPAPAVDTVSGQRRDQAGFQYARNDLQHPLPDRVPQRRLHATAGRRRRHRHPARRRRVPRSTDLATVGRRGRDRGRGSRYPQQSLRGLAIATSKQ